MEKETYALIVPQPKYLKKFKENMDFIVKYFRNSLRSP